MKFLKDVWDIFRGVYYFMFVMFGYMGLDQIWHTAESDNMNIVITIVSLFCVDYGVKNMVRVIKDIWKENKE